MVNVTTFTSVVVTLLRLSGVLCRCRDAPSIDAESFSRDLSSIVWNYTTSDPDSLDSYYSLNIQNKRPKSRAGGRRRLHDAAPNRLFTRVDWNGLFRERRAEQCGRKASSPPADVGSMQARCQKANRAMLAFVKLFDNYHPDQRENDEPSRGEVQEINAFLNRLVETDVIRDVFHLLKRHQLLCGTKKEMKRALRQLWFTSYARSRRPGSTCSALASSGFEHVFLGEYGCDRRSISGLHNWIRFVYEEHKSLPSSQDSLNYLGYLTSRTLSPPHQSLQHSRQNFQALKFSARWKGKDKAVTSFFVGLRIEAEVALFTACHYVNELGRSRPSPGVGPSHISCRLTTAGRPGGIRIQTFSRKAASSNTDVITTAYPDI